MQMMAYGGGVAMVIFLACKVHALKYVEKLDPTVEMHTERIVSK